MNHLIKIITLSIEIFWIDLRLLALDIEEFLLT